MPSFGNNSSGNFAQNAQGSSTSTYDCIFPLGCSGFGAHYEGSVQQTPWIGEPAAINVLASVVGPAPSFARAVPAVRPALRRLVFLADPADPADLQALVDRPATRKLWAMPH